MLDVVISSLVPVMLLIAMGCAVGRWNWVSPGGAQELSRLAFSVFGPALLFRTMSHVDPATLVLQPLAVYLGSAVALYWAMWWFWGRKLSAAMWAMASMFSNTVALGIPLVGYVYGPPGLVVVHLDFGAFTGVGEHDHLEPGVASCPKQPSSHGRDF